MFVNCSLETPQCGSRRANVFSNVAKLRLLGFHLKVEANRLQKERDPNLCDAVNLEEPKQAATDGIMVRCPMETGEDLTAAAARGSTSEVQRILEQSGVHPDTVNEFGRTALQVMMMGNSKIAALLLEKGAEPNIQDRHGIAPVHDAARTGFLDTVLVLVAHGALVNIPDQSGTLPIHIAIREGHRDVVEFLAPRSDLRHANLSGQTAIDVARASGEPDMIDLVFAHIHR